ncbi:MAG: PDZ domain-containing protein [Balneolaceae bacterium]
MKITVFTFLILPILILSQQLAEAQTTRTMSFDASTNLMLEEFQSMLVLDGNEVKVEIRLGGEDAKPGVDRLEQGDVVLMMNGKRVNDIESLRELYSDLEKDAEIKIGVQRGNERFILTAIKGEVPEGGPRMVMSFDDEGDGEPPVIVPSLGILLVDLDEGVHIERVIPPLLSDELKPLEIEGYRIVSFNNEKPESAASLMEKIKTLSVGDSISFVFEKDGDEKTITFSKKKPKGNFSIQTEN